MGNKLLLYIFFVLSSVNIVFGAISISPTSWDTSLNPSQTDSKIFLFNQTTENTTTSLALTKTGSNSDWLNFSSSTFSVGNGTTASITATVKVPSTAVAGTYLMKMKYDSSEIPIIVTVVENATATTESIGGCRLEPFPDSYTIPFVVGASPLTQQFSVLVSRKCTEEVNIKTPVITGNTQTKNGLRPLNLYGGSKLGFIEPNKEGTFEIQIDGSELPSGTYKPQVLITGIYKGEQLSTKISFTIEIKQGATPLESASILPTYIFSSSDLALNNTYTITAQNLNPNFQPFVEQNDYIRGIRVDTSNGWVYSFQPIKIGNVKLRVSTYFAGAPIGDITEKEVRISYGSATSIGSKMCFQFFVPSGKTIDALSSGDSVTFLVRATNNGGVECNSNETTIINDADAYKNGAKLTTNSFQVNEGEIITLSASAPGFTSIDKVILTTLNQVGISLNPIPAEVGTQLIITPTPPEATVTINGEAYSGNFTPQQEGTITLLAKYPGYKQNEMSVEVTPKLKIISPEIPKKIKLDEPYFLEYNKPVQWLVAYSEKKNATTSSIFAQANSKTIEFIPNKKGFYKVYARNDVIGDYKVSSLFGFLNISIPSYVWWAVAGVILIAVIIKVKSKGSESSEGKKGASYEFPVDDFEH